jgi:hypothetical protein
MSTISSQLQGLLDNFSMSDSVQSLGGKSSAIYQDLLAAINASQPLADQMTQAIMDRKLTEIDFISGSGTLEYNPNSGALQLGDNGVAVWLNDMTSSDPNTVALGVDGFVGILGHETAHANDQAQLIIDETNEISVMPSSGSSVAQNDVWVEAYGAISLKNEAKSYIEQWNDIVGVETARNGGSIPSAQLNTMMAQFEGRDVLFQQQADDTWSFKSTITRTGNVIDDTTTNENVAANFVKVLQPSSLETDGTYGELDYGAGLELLADERGGEVSVSYNDLGLTLPPPGGGNDSIDSQAVSQFIAARGFDHPYTVHDTDDGSTSAFAVDPSGKGTLLTYTTAIAADGSSEAVHADIAKSGSAVWSENDTFAGDGSVSVLIVGQGAVVDQSSATISVTSKAVTSILGDGNTIEATTDSSGTEIGIVGTGNVITTKGNIIDIGEAGTSNEVDGKNNTIKILDAGDATTLKSTGNQIELVPENEVVTITGGQNTLQLDGNGDQVTLTASGNTIAAADGLSGEVIKNTGSLTINAGDNDAFTVSGGSITFNGGANDTLDASGFTTATLGASSTVTVEASQFALLTQSQGQVILNTNSFAEITGTGDTITGATGAEASITGDGNTYNGAGTVLASGSNEIFNLADGGSAQFTGVTNGDTIHVSSGSVAFADNSSGDVIGSQNTLNYFGSGSFSVSGDTNSIEEGVGATVTLAGSTNTVDGSNTTLHVTSGSGNIISLGDSVINADDGTDMTVSGEQNTINAGKVTISLTGDINTLNAGNQSIVVVSGDDNTLNLSDSLINVSVEEMAVGTAIVGSSNVISGDPSQQVTLTGDDNVFSLSQSTLTFAGSGSGDNALTIDGSDNHVTTANNTTPSSFKVTGVDNTFALNGSTVTYTGPGTGDGDNGEAITMFGGDDLLITNNTVISDGVITGALTVRGTGNTIDASDENLVFDSTASNQTETINGAGDTIHAGAGTFTFTDGSMTFFGGDGDTLNVTSTSDVITVNNATIHVADGSTLTVIGSNDTVLGSSSGAADSIHVSVSGTNDHVTATNSNIVFGAGDNTGDTVVGAGDEGSNWSAPDPNLPPGDNGGYTPPPSNPSAVQRFSATSVAHVDSAASPDPNLLIHGLAAFLSHGGGSLDHVMAANQSTEHLLLASAG